MTFLGLRLFQNLQQKHYQLGRLDPLLHRQMSP